MPHPFRITISASGTNEAEELAGEFSDAEWNQLSRFLIASFRLAACRIVETQSQLHFGIKGEVGKPTVHEVSLPPESDIAEFLLRMRPFLLQDEDTYFHKVRNTLAKHLALPRARAYLEVA